MSGRRGLVVDFIKTSVKMSFIGLDNTMACNLRRAFKVLAKVRLAQPPLRESGEGGQPDQNYFYASRVP